MTSRHFGGGRGRGRFRKQSKAGSSYSTGEEGRKSADLNEASPVIQAFRIFQAELDSRNDRNERIVKLSRDITIESKRIIFLLQRCSGSQDKESVLNEAAAKFKDLYETKFYPLALELEGQDPYQFLRAFSPGLQEYIEALTFYHYLVNGSLIGVDKVQSDLSFFKEAPDSSLHQNSEQTTSTPRTENVSHPSDVGKEKDTSHLISDGLRKNVEVPIPPSEYMLGVADFTGELMRMAINSVGAGDLETPSLVLNLMRVIHCAFNSFGNVPRELRQKTKVLSQSLQKVERACYTLRVRGSEIPKHMLADVFTTVGSMPVDNFQTEELDEQFD